VWGISIFAKYQWQDRENKFKMYSQFENGRFIPTRQATLPILGLGYKPWNRDAEALYFRPSFNTLVKLLCTPPPFFLIGDIKKNQTKKPSKTHNRVRRPCSLP